MKKEIAELWIKELKSGNWEQTKETLKDKNGYCCLGVLCEIAAKQGICGRRNELDYYTFDGVEDVLPKSVLEWAGMKSDNGSFDEGDEHSLIHLNDKERYDFFQIAEVIESNLEIL